MKAIILCAGYATRLYPLTKDTPKALLSINGTPLLSYTTRALNNIKEIDAIYIVSNGKFYSKFEEWKERLSLEKDLIILNNSIYSEEDKIGAIGDLWKVIVENNLDDDLLVILGDNLFDFNLSEMISNFRNVNRTFLGAYRVNDPAQLRQLGVVDVREKIITSFEDRPKNPRSNLASTGIYIFTKDDISLIEEYMQTDKPKEGVGFLLIDWMKSRPINAFVFEGKWFDIGNIDNYREANESWIMN